MSWTDERVAKLRDMWLDGKSASQIAAVLANGITRNAVIGKVHRLGLSGRVKPNGQSAQRLRPAKAPSPPPPPREEIRQQPPRTHGANALAWAPLVDPRPVERPVEDVVIPISERVTIMELKEDMCRWPLGDPQSMDFRYCGSKSPIGVPYCAHHSRVAYQPVQDRRRPPRAAVRGA